MRLELKKLVIPPLKVRIWYNHNIQQCRKVTVIPPLKVRIWYNGYDIFKYDTTVIPPLKVRIWYNRLVFYFEWDWGIITTTTLCSMLVNL